MVKSALIALLVIASSLGLSAQKIKWLSFEEAMALNKKEPRNIIIDVYTDWCGWCKTMDQQTFSQAAITKIINENYYAVKFNAETKDTIHYMDKDFVSTNQGNRPPHELAVALLQGKLSYPNLVFMNKNSQVLGAIPGFKKPDELEAILDYITKELYNQKVDLGQYIQNYKTAPSN